jgi:hypothetical protein
MTKIKASTQFINVMVKVTGKSGDYKVTTAPVTPYVTQRDTVINYQLYDTDGQDIILTGATFTPADNDQLSNWTISPSGKVLTFSDANTEKMILGVTLSLTDPSGHTFLHDPQVQNTPEA